MKSLKDELKEISIWGSIRKLGEWGTAFGVFWFFILPKIQESQDERIEKFHQEDNSKIKFRTLLSTEFGVNEDRVHIYLNDELTQIKGLKADFYEVFGWIKDEMDVITPRLIIIEHKEFWLDVTGELNRVHRDQNGRGQYFSDGKWNFIYW